MVLPAAVSGGFVGGGRKRGFLFVRQADGPLRETLRGVVGTMCLLSSFEWESYEFMTCCEDSAQETRRASHRKACTVFADKSATIFF